MAIDFSKPGTSDNYSTAFVPNIQANQVGLAQWLDSSQTTVTGTPPTYAKRYNRTSSVIEEYNGTIWGQLPLLGLRYANGALGFGGLTPSAWSGFNALEMAGGSSFAATANGPYVNQNSYWNGTNWIAKSTGVGSQFQQAAGAFYWNQAPSASAGAAHSFATSMQLDASGRLGLGVTPSYRLDVRQAAHGTLGYFRNSTGGQYTEISTDSFGPYIGFGNGSAGLRIFDGAAERLRIDSNGNVGLGGSPTNRLHILGGTSNTIYMVGAIADLSLQTTANGVELGTPNNSNIVFNTNGAERMRLSNTGNLGLGTAPIAGAIFMAHTGSNRNVGLFDQASQATISGLTDAGGAATLRVAGSTLTFSGDGSTEQARLDTGGQFGLGLTPVTSGNNRALLQLLGSSNGGIYLGNTANAASNALDWYEEGTFTVVAKGATTAGTGSYVTQVGRFVRIGRLVFVTINISWSSHTGSGLLLIDGLPYGASVGYLGAMNAVPWGPTSLAADAWTAEPTPGQTYFKLDGINQNTGASTQRQLVANDSWYIHGFYEV